MSKPQAAYVVMPCLDPTVVAFGAASKLIGQIGSLMSVETRRTDGKSSGFLGFMQLVRGMEARFFNTLSKKLQRALKEQPAALQPPTEAWCDAVMKSAQDADKTMDTITAVKLGGAMVAVALRRQFEEIVVKNEDMGFVSLADFQSAALYTSSIFHAVAESYAADFAKTHHPDLVGRSIKVVSHEMTLPLLVFSPSPPTSPQTKFSIDPASVLDQLWEREMPEILQEAEEIAREMNAETAQDGGVTTEAPAAAPAVKAIVAAMRATQGTRDALDLPSC